MIDMVEFARALAAEADRRGMRIVIEPVKPATETLELPVESKPTEAITVPQIVPAEQKAKVKEEHSWLTVAQAARMMGISTVTIYDHIRRGTIPWQKNERGVKTVSTDVLNGLPGHRPGHSKPVPVQCIETGKIFNSQGEAARYYGVDSGRIRNISQNTNYTCRGLHFCRVNQKNGPED